VDAALSAPEPSPLPTPGQQTFKGMSAGKAKGKDGQRRPGLHVIRGGRK
jgi:hypothetical protein